MGALPWPYVGVSEVSKTAMGPDKRLWLNQKRSSPKRLNNLSKKREDLRNKSNGMKTFVSGQLARVESC